MATPRYSTVDYSGGGRVGAGVVGTTGPSQPAPSYDPTPPTQGIVTAGPGGGLRIQRVNVPEGYRSDIFGHVTQVNPNGSPRTTTPTTTPTYTPTSGGGSRSGGSSTPPIDINSIMALINRKPQQQTWQDAQWSPYQAQPFYNFDTSIYDTARTGLNNAITADTAAGNASYAQGMAELQQYQNPFNNPTTVSNPQQSAAMQRMMQANNVPTNINQADTNRGVQADQAFGNLLAVLGGVNDQAQASRVRALQGDQRGFGERMAAEQRGGNLGIDMQMAAARRQYDIDKWTYGEEVARKNYDGAMENIYYNNQGQNQTNQANVQGANDWNQQGIATLVDLIAGGATVDPAAFIGA